MNIDINEIIKMQEKLSNLIGCPGYEEEVAEFILSQLNDYVDRAWIDPLGNVLAIKKGTVENGMKILLDAHMDEVGFMISHIEEKGFLRIAPLGGIDKRVMFGTLLQFQTDNNEKIIGIVGSHPPHITKSEERESVPEISEMFVDIGCQSREEVLAKGLHVGSVGTFYTKFEQLDDETVIGKAFDDRTACNVLLQVLKALKDVEHSHTILAVFAVQEEVGGRGATVGAFELQPTIALALENTIASDVVGVPPNKVVTSIGNGPAVTAADRSLITPKKVLNRINQAAEKDNIKTQYKMPIFGGSDGGRIAITRSGVPTGVVSVPCRYIHGPVAILKIKDIAETIKLVYNFCTI
ncbi:MAG: M42 family metallopeptidase [Candidatus Heimdallarchaeaceae archaeon]